MTRRELLAAALVLGNRPEHLVIEAASGKIIRSDFAPGRREPVGSLVKVFTALAYGARSQFPTVECTGQDCWYAAGHGHMQLTMAIAHSCNCYFLELARAVSSRDVALLCSSFRIAGPHVDSPEARIGLGRGWIEAPEALLMAYLSLAQRRAEPGVGAIVEGLKLAATGGTARACGPGVLAKTGTAVCVHRPAMPGDGWALGMFPADLPRYAALVRVHGVPGAVAAGTLAERIKALRTGR